MSTERRDPGRTDARKSADRKIFREIDAKVAVATDMWRTAMMLPIPLASDSNELIDAEARALNGVFVRSKQRMPDSFAAYERFLVLDDHLKNSSETLERADAIREEMDVLKDTQGFELAGLITLGVPRLIMRRMVLRDLQVQFGEPDPETGMFENPQVLSKIPGVGFRGDQITRAIMGAYSVSIFVTKEAYQSQIDKGTPGTNGTHLGSPADHVNIIKDYMDELLLEGAINPKDIRGNLYKTLLHEEFHGFADAFTSRDVDYFTQLKKALTNQTVLISDAINQGDFQTVQALTERIRRLLRKVPDSSTEELLAEMASAMNRDGMPVSTFAAHNPKKGELLDFMDSQEALSGINVRRTAGNLIDLELFRERMKIIYAFLEGEEDPKTKERRREEIDALFAVIPPSKIIHIWKTVSRWKWGRENTTR